MEFAMNWSFVLVLFGVIVCVIGMCWSMLDGRLWNNPGDAVMGWGAGICMVGTVIMLVILLLLVVQYALNNGTCQL